MTRDEINARVLSRRAELTADNRCVSRQGKMNARIGHEIGLKFVQIDVQCTFEPERGRDGRDDLSDQTIEIRIRRPFDV